MLEIVRAKYPGIEYSRALYATLNEAIANAENASESYICTALLNPHHSLSGT